MRYLRRLLLSLLAALAWGVTAELVAYLAGRYHRHFRPGAIGLLDEL